MAAPVPANPKAQAEKNLAALINHRLFPHGGEGHTPFLESSVEIGVGLEPGSLKQQKEALQITVRDAHADMLPSEVKRVVLDVLKDIPALKQYVNFEEQPSVRKDPDKPGAMAFDFALPEGKAAEMVQAFAALTPVQPPSAELQFAKIDSVELIGGAFSPQQIEVLKALLAPYKQADAPIPTRQIEETLVPQAQEIIKRVQEAAAAKDNPAEALQKIGEANALINRSVAMAAQAGSLPASMVSVGQVANTRATAATPNCA